MTHSYARALTSSIKTLSLAGAIAVASAAAWAEEQVIKSHGFAEFGALKYPAGFAHFDYVNPNAPKGGELSYSSEGTFDSFNPYARKGRAGKRAGDQYETLLVESYDEVGVYYGLLAESVEYPETQDWVIFNLREEARFSDGTPVRARDVVFSHNIFLEQGLKSYADAVRKRVIGVEALDPLRVKFTFAPDISRRALISQVGGTPVMSMAWYEANNARLDEARLVPGVGSAPYVLESYDINRRIVYKRNPDYWGADINVNVGRFNFDRIRIEYFTDSNSAFEAFKAGDFAFRQENSSKTWAAAYDFPAIKNGHVVKKDLEDGNTPNATGIVLNVTRAKFADPRVREALGLAYNFEWTNQSLQYGVFRQRESFWQNSRLAANGVPEGAELALLENLGDVIAPEILTEPVVMPHSSNPARPSDRKNMRRASKLLDEAGWTVGDDGLRRNAEGTVLRVEFLSGNPTFDRIIIPYIDNLKRLGIDAAYNRVDDAQFTARRRDRDFDMIYSGYTTTLQPSTGLFQQYGQEAASYSVFNPAGVSGPDIEALITRIVAAKTDEELVPAVRALDRVLRSKRFIVPAWYLGKHWVAYFDKYEHPDLPPYMLGVEDLWWEVPEKAEKLRDAKVAR